jgi:hypothetical protein
MTALTSVPDAVVAIVAEDPSCGPFPLRNVLRSADSAVVDMVNSFLAELPQEAVAATLQDARFRFFTAGSADVDREARIWLTDRLLVEEVPRRRIALLRSQATRRRPTPLELDALSDVAIDSEHLVPLSIFAFDGSRLCRNGYAFTVLCTTGSANSTYWLLASSYETGIADCTSVRLDPFLCGPTQSFPSMFYRMWIYGRPIDWDRLRRLRASEHGRWQPGPLGHQGQFTDFVWDPRGAEVHFLAEEVPRIEDALTAGARYVHAIYDRASDRITHLDGALRFYTPRELEQRHQTHVRQTGKVGLREKVFRTDAPIPRETLSLIVQTFFVWNYDVAEYFTGTIAA